MADGGDRGQARSRGRVPCTILHHGRSGPKSPAYLPASRCDARARSPCRRATPDGRRGLMSFDEILRYAEIPLPNPSPLRGRGALGANSPSPSQGGGGWGEGAGGWGPSAGDYPTGYRINSSNSINPRRYSAFHPRRCSRGAPLLRLFALASKRWRSSIS